MLLVSDASLAPLFDRLPAPVRLFAWLKVMALAPAEKLLVPPTVATPVWVIAPVELTVRFRPTPEVPSTVAMLLVNDASLAPLFDRLTAPVKAFAWVNVIALAPAAKLLVPATVATPVCVIAPVALTVRMRPIPNALTTAARLT